MEYVPQEKRTKREQKQFPGTDNLKKTNKATFGINSIATDPWPLLKNTMILSNGVLGLNEEVLFQSPLLLWDEDNEGMYSQLPVERTLQVFV